MKVWTLIVVFGITGWGAGGQKISYFPDKASCYEALENLRVSGQSRTAGDDDEQVIAYCSPETK